MSAQMPEDVRKYLIRTLGPVLIHMKDQTKRQFLQEIVSSMLKKHVNFTSEAYVALLEGVAYLHTEEYKAIKGRQFIEDMGILSPDEIEKLSDRQVLELLKEEEYTWVDNISWTFVGII